MLLTEFEETIKAIINPEDLIESLKDFPMVAVSCFARETFARILAGFSHREIARTSMANIEIPVYEVLLDGQSIALYNSPVGASACVAIAEDLAAMGMQKLVLFGTCGVLNEAIAATSVIVPTAALRDEGTSFHYAPAGNELLLNQAAQQVLLDFLNEEKISHSQGKVWTTDGIYRETIDKLNRRKEAGAVCVDMECAAMVAWAAFREVSLCQFFYAADHLSEEKWDPRSLGNDADLDEKDKVAAIALAVAQRL
ncbi:nucleoside phosphorylase [Streptococcus massiliensis]|uniref:Uridine phosphorylase n=1 Tax=Streptococcus massiliensis TaxID=313439 RepID=A0A380L0I9_9STRE|nr:nucleoside phosphorylase [Streptococcus massiliensis]SUN77312.1 phosphorylase Pnp/Udp family protein [Streptococcus massiliensis]